VFVLSKHLPKHPAITTGFAQAFSIALKAYIKSAVRDEANQAIKLILEGRDIWRLDHFSLEKLGDIIKNHRLCM
jgi:hypothetical protein